MLDSAPLSNADGVLITIAAIHDNSLYQGIAGHMHLQKKRVLFPR